MDLEVLVAAENSMLENIGKGVKMRASVHQSKDSYPKINYLKLSEVGKQEDKTCQKLFLGGRAKLK